MQMARFEAVPNRSSGSGVYPITCRSNKLHSSKQLWQSGKG